MLFHPLDFTFVCPTEVLNFSDAAIELAQLNRQIFGISVDSQYVHKAWVDTKREDGGLGGSLNYPLLSDLNKQIARDYGIFMEEGVALRGLFLINPDGIIMHSTINNLSVGRSVIEAKRVLKAFQFVTTHEGQVCPADWEEGKDTMVAESEQMEGIPGHPLISMEMLKGRPRPPLFLSPSRTETLDPPERVEILLRILGKLKLLILGETLRSPGSFI